MRLNDSSSAPYPDASSGAPSAYSQHVSYYAKTAGAVPGSAGAYYPSTSTTMRPVVPSLHPPLHTSSTIYEHTLLFDRWLNTLILSILPSGPSIKAKVCFGCQTVDHRFHFHHPYDHPYTIFSSNKLELYLVDLPADTFYLFEL